MIKLMKIKKKFQLNFVKLIYRLKITFKIKFQLENIENILNQSCIKILNLIKYNNNLRKALVII